MASEKISTRPNAPSPTVTDQRASSWRWPCALGAGLLAGLVAALAMTLVMGLARVLVGLPTPAELIGDVFIPSLNLDQFFKLLIQYGGGSELKKRGIGSVLAGQIVAGTLLGLVYAALIPFSWIAYRRQASQARTAGEVVTLRAVDSGQAPRD